MDRFTLDRKAGSGISTSVDEAVGTGGVVLHVAAGHFTCKLKATLAATKTGSVKIFDCVSDKDDGEEIADEALVTGGTTYLAVPEWDGTYLRFVFTTNDTVSVEIVSH